MECCCCWLRPFHPGNRYNFWVVSFSFVDSFNALTSAGRGVLAFYSVFTGSSALPVAAIVTVAVCICFGFTFRVALIKSFFLVKYSASFGGPAIQSFVVHDIVRPSHSCGRCQAKHERECVGGGGGGGCGDRGRCHFDQDKRG